MDYGLYSALLRRPGLSSNRGIALSHFSQFQYQSVQFSYAVKPGGPEWGKRRLWAAQGVFRAVQTGAKDLDLTAASWIPGFTPLSCSDRAFPGTGK